MGNAEEEVGCFCSSCLGGWEGERVGCWEGKVSSRLCGAVYSLLAGPRGKLAITCKSAVFAQELLVQKCLKPIIKIGNVSKNRMPYCCLNARWMIQQPARTDRQDA